MAIRAGMCWVAVEDFLAGLHQPGDPYHVALYRGDAELGPETEAYTERGEVFAPPAYQPGGKALTGYTRGRDGGVAWLSWANPLWPVATITAAAALIYNPARSRRAIAVFDFGGDVVSVSGPFRVEFPPAGPNTAAVRLRA